MIHTRAARQSAVWRRQVAAHIEDMATKLTQAADVADKEAEAGYRPAVVMPTFEQAIALDHEHQQLVSALAKIGLGVAQLDERFTAQDVAVLRAMDSESLADLLVAVRAQAADWLAVARELAAG